jgi:hypothetical protein
MGQFVYMARSSRVFDLAARRAEIDRLGQRAVPKRFRFAPSVAVAQWLRRSPMRQADLLTLITFKRPEC